MAGEFYYSPGVQDQRPQMIVDRGAAMGQAIGGGLATLGAAIGSAEKRHKELKMKRDLLGMYAEQIGQDPKSVEKLPLDKVDAALAFAPVLMQRQQQKQQGNALATALKGYVQRGKPQANLNTPARTDYTGGAMMRAMPSTALGNPDPGMNPRDNLASTLAAAVSGGANPDTLKTITSLAKVLGTASGVNRDPSGLITFDGKPVAPGWAKVLGSAGSRVQSPEITTATAPGGGTIDFFGNKIVPARDIQGAPKTGKYPKGTTYTTQANGIVIATYPDGSTDVVHNPPQTTGDEDAQIEKAAKGGSGAGAPAAKSPVTITDRKGQKWLYKGSAADPKTDTETNNWEKIESN